MIVSYWEMPFRSGTNLQQALRLLCHCGREWFRMNKYFPPDAGRMRSSLLVFQSESETNFIDLHFGTLLLSTEVATELWGWNASASLYAQKVVSMVEPLLFTKHFQFLIWWHELPYSAASLPEALLPHLRYSFAEWRSSRLLAALIAVHDGRPSFCQLTFISLVYWSNWIDVQNVLPAMEWRKWNCEECNT